MTRSLFFCCLGSVIFLLSCGSDEGVPSSNPNNITFISEPPSETDHNRMFNFIGSATHKSGDPLTIRITKPEWLNLDETNNRVYGIPDWIRLNQSFRIDVMATNGIDTAFQKSSVRIGLGEIVCDSEFGLPENSQYKLPFQVGETYQVNQTYCPSNPNWGDNKTFAYDFETPMGTKVIAMRSGRVIAIRNDRPDHILDCVVGGNYVFILHDDGTQASYFHFMQFGVKVSVGNEVAQGQLIGLSGNSGCSSGPHTHVQINRDRYHLSREYSMPFNFNNADGPLNAKRGLVQDGIYTAL